MNRMKRLISLICVVGLCLGLVACGSSGGTSSTPTEPGDAIYTVHVSTPSGVLPQGLTVYVYEDSVTGTLVDMGPLNERGEFTFTDRISDRYIAVIQGLPEEGYDRKDSYPITGVKTEIVLTSSVVQGADPTGKVYQLGDVMRDFSVTTVDGQTMKLSELLKDKDAVVLNFWNTKSSACKKDLSLLQNVCGQLGDRVAVIAMNAKQDETEGQVSRYQMDNGLTIPVAKVDSSWEQAMQLADGPATVVIDRYGVICMIHTGSVGDEALFAGMFNHFSATSYQQKLIKNIEEFRAFQFPEGSESNPYRTYGDLGAFRVTVAPNSQYHTLISRAEGVTLHLEDLNAYVLYDGQRFDPDQNGKITVKLNRAEDNHVILGNTGNEALTLNVVMEPPASLPLGSIMNPFPLELGDLTVQIEKNRTEGIYYSVTAPENGFLRLTITDVPESYACQVELYNMTTMTQYDLGDEKLEDSEGNAYLLLPVNKDDVIRIGFLPQPDQSGKYPAAEIKARIEFSDQAESIAYMVTFRDDAGNPISGVSISLMVDGVLTTFVSDEAGVILMELAPNNYSVTVHVPSGYTAATTQYLLTASNPNREIELQVYVPQVVTYTVRVVDRDGNPIPDVTVAVGDSFAHTDADGYVRFALLEGEYFATVIPPAGYTSGSASYAFGSETSLTVVLSEGGSVSSQAEYTVTVVDSEGNPYTNVLVSFSGTSVVLPVNSNGVASTVLEKGNYQVVLLFSTGNEMGYDTASAKLTATYTSVVIQVAPYADGPTTTIHPDGGSASGRYLSLGGSFVQLTAGGRTYFLFTPQQPGVYEISTSQVAAELENWNLLEDTTQLADGLENNRLTLEVAQVGSTYVFAVDAGAGISSTIIRIQRTGDVTVEPDEEPEPTPAWILPTRFPADHKHNKKIGTPLCADFSVCQNP